VFRRITQGAWCGARASSNLGVAWRGQSVLRPGVPVQGRMGAGKDIARDLAQKPACRGRDGLPGPWHGLCTGHHVPHDGTQRSLL
jgi:hypothetical protein